MTNIDPNERDVHGTSKVTEVPKKKSGVGWLVWLIGALLLLALLLLLLRSCGHRAAVAPAVAPPPAASAAATPAVAIEAVTLPGGRVVNLEPNTINYELQRFLASNEPTPRTFTFDKLNFATDSAELPADAQNTVTALAQILTAYPRARVQLQGYADSTGSDPHNVQLGAQRASAVAKALVAQGVATGRVTTATGGSTKPVDSNATSQGRAENRRTELAVLAK